jgi:hypothetical protein
MKPRSAYEDDGIPLDDPQDDVMDNPEAGMPGPADGAPSAEAEEDADALADLDALGALDDPPQEEGEEPAAQGTGAITGKYNSSPVGDIKMTKSKGTYNTYKLEMSMGQLEVIRNALENNHADPVSDELLATLTYYMDKLPGPGEEEEESDMRKAGAGGEDGPPIPMPPGSKGAGAPAPAGGKPPLPPKPGQPPPTPAKERLMANAPGGAPGAGGKQPVAGLPDFDEEEGGAGGELPPPPAE